jgi:hypothetical protein
MRLPRILLATTTALTAVAFETKAGWKVTDGKIETDSDGNPIYITDDGSETAVKYDTAIQLRGEAKAHRTRAERAEAELKKFEGIDPKAAREALDKLKDVDLDKLVASDKLEEVTAQMKQQYENDLRTRDEKAAEIQRENDNLRLENAFSSSEFLSTRVALPADVVQKAFRDRFKVDNGKIVPLDDHGQPLYSKKAGSEYATVDEAFETYITARPDKDSWLKAPDASGSGSQGGGGGRGTGNTMKRADYDALDQGKKTEIGMKVAKGEIQVVD